MDLSLLSYGAKTAMEPQQQQLSPARVEDQKATRLFGEAEMEVEEAEAVVMDPSVAVGAKYRECMRNHAASIGGLASDGCGEFMPSSVAAGEKGDAPLSCAACGCHRSFHRREPDARERVHHNRRRHRVVHSPPPSSILLYSPGPTTPRWDQNNKLVHVSAPAPLQAHVSTNHLNNPNNNHRHAIQHQLNRNASGGAISAVDPAEDGRSETPEREEVGSEMRISSSATTSGGGGTNKRFRTKFTAEQKERMAEYAEKAGWRIHRQDDVALSAFCAEIGVKRNVLKVWMHNNKAAAAIRRTETAPPPPPPAVSAPPPPPQHAGV